MRVEIVFGGDSLDAVEASKRVVDSLQKLFLQSDETAASLREVKITSTQATESEANTRRMKDQLELLRLKADETSRAVRNVHTSGFPQGTAANLQSFQTLGLAGLLGLGTAASGPAGAAAGGLLAALPAMLLTVGGAVGTAALAFHGMSSAIDGNKAAFDKLNPEAKDFVSTIRSLSPWVKSLQSDAQKGILPGADNLLSGLLSPANAVAIEKAVTDIGGAIGQVETQFGKAFASPAFTSGFGELAQHMSTWLRDDGDAAVQFASGIAKITLAGLPLDDWLVKSIDHGAHLFNTWVDGEKASGGLARGMDSMQHEMQLVGPLLQAFVTAAFDLSKALLPLGNSVIGDATHALIDFDKWVNANKEAINQVAQGALTGLIRALHDLQQIIEPVGRTVFDLTKDTVGLNKAFEDLVLAFAAWKTTGLLTKFAGIGSAAGEAGAAGSVGLLLTRLGTLAKLGTIGVEIDLSMKSGLDSKVSDFVHNLGSVLHSNVPSGTDLLKLLIGSPGNAGIGGNAIWNALGIKPPPTDPGSAVAPGAGLVNAAVSGIGAAATKVSGGNTVGKAKMLQLAKDAIGTPYAWSGDSPGGFDCSGLVMWAFANGLDINLPRTTYEQVNVGTAIGTNTLKGATPGDVIFAHYGETEHGVTNSGPGHEGIYVGNGQVLAAPHTGANVGITSLAAFTGGGKYTVRDLTGQTVAPDVKSPIGGAQPPWTSGLGSTATIGFQLPLLLQTAVDRAQTTKGSADDRKAYADAVDWLRKQIAGGLTNTQAQPDLDTAYQLLSSYLSQLKSLQTTAKKALPEVDENVLDNKSEQKLLQQMANYVIAQGKARTDEIAAVNNLLAGAKIPKPPGPLTLGKGGTVSIGPYHAASQAADLSAQNLVSSVLGLLNTNPAGPPPATPQSEAAALKSFKDLKSKLEPEIKALSKEIASGLLTPSDLATVRAQLTQYKTTITAGLQSAQQAVADEKSSFQSAFQAIGNTAIQSLQQLAANYQSPADIALAALQQAHSDQQLQTALDQANQDLANALVPVPDSSTIVANIKAILGQYNQANVIDQVQSTILGGKALGVDGSTLLSQLNQAITAASAPDPTAVKQAQQEVADAQYNIQVDSLQKLASVQDNAYTDQINSQIAAITTLEGNWETYYGTLKGNILDIGSTWQTLLQNLGVPQDVITDALNANPAAPSAPSAPSAPTVPTQSGPNSPGYLDPGQWAYGPGGPVQLHAKGGIAMRPIYRNVIGEAGPEAIIPLNDPRAAGMMGGQHVTVELHGDLAALEPYMTKVVRRSIPMINRELGQDAANRLKTGRY